MFDRRVMVAGDVIGVLLFGAVLIAPSSAHAQPYTERALANPAIANKLRELGVVITPGTPDEFATFIKSQTELWSGVIKSAEIKPD